MNEINFDYNKKYSDPTRQYFWIIEEKSSVRVGISLALISALFVVIYIFSYIMIFVFDTKSEIFHRTHYIFNIGRDESLSEKINHGMLFFCSISFLYIFYETKLRIALFFCSFFSFMWFDDSFQYHERVGKLIAENIEFSDFLGLRGQDFGELIAWMFAAIILFALGLWWYKGRKEEDVFVLKGMAIPVASLVFCGVVFDMAHSVLEGALANGILTALEDGGEMISISAILAVSVAILKNFGRIYRIKN